MALGLPSRMDDVRQTRESMGRLSRAQRVGTEFQAVHPKIKARRANAIQNKDPLVRAFQKDIRLALAGLRAPEGTLSEVGPKVEPLERVRALALKVENELAPKLKFLDRPDVKARQLVNGTPEQWAILKDKGLRGRATGYFKALVEEVSKYNGAYANMLAQEVPSLQASYLSSLSFFHEQGLAKRRALVQEYQAAKAAGDTQAMQRIVEEGKRFRWTPVTMNKDAMKLAMEGKASESVLLNKIAGVVQSGKHGAFEPLHKQLENLRDPEVGARYRQREDWKPPRSDEDFLSVKLGPGDAKIEELDTGELEQIVAQNPYAEREKKILRRREQAVEDKAAYFRGQGQVAKYERESGVLGKGVLKPREMGDIRGKLAALKAYDGGVPVEETAAKLGKRLEKGQLKGNTMLLELLGSKETKQLIRAGEKIPIEALRAAGKKIPGRVAKILRLLELGL